MSEKEKGLSRVGSGRGRRMLEESTAMIKRRAEMDVARVKDVRELTRLYESMRRAGFKIREREVDAAAERMWRTTSLNYSAFDAFKWGEDFWKDQPSGKRHCGKRQSRMPWSWKKWGEIWWNSCAANKRGLRAG